MLMDTGPIAHAEPIMRKLIISPQYNSAFFGPILFTNHGAKNITMASRKI